MFAVCATATLGLAGCGQAETFGPASGEAVEETSEAITGGWTNLVLQNGWSAGVPTSPAVGIVNGTITFRGMLVGSAGAGLSPFTLPPGFRPYPNPDGTGLDSVRLRVSMSGNEGGSLTFLFKNLTNTYETELRQDGYNGPGTAARNMTSLEGVTVDATGSDATPLDYAVNDWVSVYSFRSQGPEPAASVKMVGDFARFQGFLQGASHKDPNHMLLFTLPAAFVPSKDVYVPVSLCSAAATTYGRLRIARNGQVSVEPPNGNVGAANCGVSLEGVSYSLATAASNLPLATGWSAYSTRPVSVRKTGGVIRLGGAVKGNSSATTHVANMPTGTKPTSTLYLVADNGNGVRGRVIITADGKLSVDSSMLSTAKTFLSLDGVSFAP